MQHLLASLFRTRQKKRGRGSGAVGSGTVFNRVVFKFKVTLIIKDTAKARRDCKLGGLVRQAGSYGL